MMIAMVMTVMLMVVAPPAAVVTPLVLVMSLAVEPDIRIAELAVFMIIPII